MKNIMQLATENNINKVCIDGRYYDIRQIDKTPFQFIPKKYSIMEDSIFNESMLFCYSRDAVGIKEYLADS